MTPFDLIALGAVLFLAGLAAVLYFATHRKPCKRFTVEVYFEYQPYLYPSFIFKEPPLMSSVSLKAGATAQAVAVATPVDPTVTLPLATFAWTSSDDSIATVSDAGLVTAIAAGSALITATATINGVTASGSAGADVSAAGDAFTVTVTITPTP